MNIPNILSLFRVLLVPVFAALMFMNIKYNLVFSAIIFILSGLTDVLDGYIARRFNMTTKLGRILDPLADKLMQFTAVICMAIKAILPFWVPVLFFVKDFLMLIGGLKSYKILKDMPRSLWYGKLTTIVFYCFFISILIFNNMSSHIKMLLILIAVVIALFSLTMYLFRFIQIYRKDNRNNSV